MLASWSSIHVGQSTFLIRLCAISLITEELRLQAYRFIRRGCGFCWTLVAGFRRHCCPVSLIQRRSNLLYLWWKPSPLSRQSNLTPNSTNFIHHPHISAVLLIYRPPLSLLTIPLPLPLPLSTLTRPLPFTSFFALDIPFPPPPPPLPLSLYIR